jgi:hypothetical protein
MPYAVAIRGPLARYLLASPNPALRRRLGVLRNHPIPPGSRSLASDPQWQGLESRFPGRTPYLYGTNSDALVYTVDSRRERLVVEFAIVGGVLVP